MGNSIMYAGKANSPTTTLSAGISDSATSIPLTDASVLPAAPNLVVIGTGENAETVLYTGISTNTLTGCTRGFQGAAAVWGSGTQAARLFTEYDYASLKSNIESINESKNLWTDGALKYWLERITVTDPATGLYGSTLNQVKHLKASGTRGTMTVARQALTAGISLVDYALRVGTSGADSSLDADSYYLVRHYIYQGTRNHSNGGKITVSFKVASSVANQKIGVVMRQNYGTTGSPTAEETIVGEIFTLASGENEISKTFTTNSLTGKTFGTDNNDCLIVDIVVQCGATIATALFGGSAFGFTKATTLDFYELGAYPGEVVYDFVVSDDIFKVLRFYEKSYLDNILPATASSFDGAWSDYLYFAANNTAYITIPFKVDKVKIPVVVFYPANGIATANYITTVGLNNYQVDTNYSPSTKTTGRAIVISELASCWAFFWAHFVADARY